MKNILPFLLVVLLSISAIGQSNIPQLVSFSAIVRDANNQPLVNTPVSIRLTFRENGQTGPMVYCALHQTTTNQNGFMSLQLNRDVLGTGCNGAPSTDFENIPWENGSFWMEVEYQTTPGTPFENLGQLELASSFYAFAAGTAENISGMDLSGANNGDVLTYNITSGQWEPIPSGGFSGDYNDLTNTPTIPVNTSDLTNNSGFITNPADADADATNELQTLSEANGVLSLSNGGGSVTLTDTDPTNELQNLSVSSTGDTLHLQNGGFVIVPGISAAQPPSYPSGSVFCGSGATAIVDVTNPSTGAVWMDRNLGATSVGVSLNDPTAFGDLYQWGRFSDGHQCRTSGTTSTSSSSDQPNHGNFITSSAGHWRSPENSNLWQGVNGTNNPCPSGYRIPSAAELNAERLSWSSDDPAGALASALKLTPAGSRSGINGSLIHVSFSGWYWSSTVSNIGTGTQNLLFSSLFNSSIYNDAPSYGASVRCIKD